jgi:hypothetical protein
LKHLSWLIVCLMSTCGCRAAEVVPLTRAFAHNDYRHAHPLADALDCGFCAVEADIFPVDGTLLVGHEEYELRPERTLEALYLEPLRRRIAANGGRVYRDGPTIALFIDFKKPAAVTYPLLRQTLQRYSDMLTSWRGDAMTEGAVTIILTGARPAPQDVARETERFVAIDGHMTTDLDSDVPASVMPELSGEWNTRFHWTGRGSMSAADRAELRRLIDRVHAKGRRLRLWGAPDNPAAWKELLDGGVDRINTDHLAGLRDFLISYR